MIRRKRLGRLLDANSAAAPVCAGVRDDRTSWYEFVHMPKYVPWYEYSHCISFIVRLSAA
eukprot:scaffold31550_cov44-Prasinocladus_malaysianus.AAC.1